MLEILRKCGSILMQIICCGGCGKGILFFKATLGGTLENLSVPILEQQYLDMDVQVRRNQTWMSVYAGASLFISLY